MPYNISEKGRLRSACAFAHADQSHPYSLAQSVVPVYCKQQNARTQIRQRGRTGDTRLSLCSWRRVPIRDTRYKRQHKWRMVKQNAVWDAFQQCGAWSAVGSLSVQIVIILYLYIKLLSLGVKLDSIFRIRQRRMLLFRVFFLALLGLSPYFFAAILIFNYLCNKWNVRSWLRWPKSWEVKWIWQ